MTHTAHAPPPMASLKRRSKETVYVRVGAA